MVVLTFNGYKSLTIYMNDNRYEQLNLPHITLKELGFDCINPPIKMKILSNGVIDIVNENGQFISDIKLLPHQECYISNIDRSKCDFYNKYTQKVEKINLIDNYEDDKYWALTCKMRNYTVDFKLAYECEVIRDWLTKKIMWEDELYDFDIDQVYDEEIARQRLDHLRRAIINLEESDDEGVSIDSDEDTDYLELINDQDEPDEGINDNMCNQDNDFIQIVIEDVEDGKRAHSDVLISLKTMFYKMFRYIRNPHPQNCLVFEYFYDKCNYCTVKRLHLEVALVEMFVKHHHINDGSNNTPTIRVMTIIVFDSLNFDAMDMSLNRDEGDSGVNIYRDSCGLTKGIIFSGGEDKNYAFTMKDCYIVPDLLLSSDAIANLAYFPQLRDGKSFWYNYEAHRKAAESL